MFASNTADMADPAARDRSISLEEYLELEDATPVRHEYVAGQIHAMSGETRRHNRVTLNIAAWLLAAVRGGSCRVAMEGGKLRVGNAVYYPDVMVACGPELADPRLEDAPSLLVEVLSRSTRGTDRREKAMVCTMISTLDAYLLVEQERRAIERHWRGDDGTWRRATILEQGTVPISCTARPLTLDTIYEASDLPLPDERLRVSEATDAYM